MQAAPTALSRVHTTFASIRRRPALLAGLILLVLPTSAPAAEPWEQEPTPEEITTLRKRVTVLGGQVSAGTSWTTVRLPGAGFEKLPPIRFRVAASLPDESTDADLKALARHPGIVSLTASGAEMSDAGLKALAPLKGIVRIELYGQQAITDRALADLPQFPSLQVLRIAGTKVTDDGVRHLAGRKLRVLELPKGARTNDGFRHYVAAVERVESFGSYYEWPGVTDKGLAALAGHKELRSFTWWLRPPGELGSTFRKVLPTLIGLQHISLTGGDISDDYLKLLAALPKLESVNISGTRITDAGLKQLAGHRTLTELNLSRTQVTDAGLRELARMPALRELYLIDTSITDDGMRTLAAAPELHTLHLDKTRVTPAGVKAFSDRKLRMVWGDESLRTEDVLLVLLPNMPTDRELDLARWPLTDTGLAEVTKRRDVKRLSIRGKFGDKALAGLGAMAGLHSLRVHNDKFTAAGVRPWRDLKHLESLSLHGTVSAGVLRELQGCKSLEYLHVSGVLTTEEMRFIAGMEKLRSLSLDRAGFNNSALAELTKLPHLATLIARESSLSDDGLLALAASKSLKWIDASYSRVTLDGKAAFAKLRPDCEVYEGE